MDHLRVLLHQPIQPLLHLPQLAQPVGPRVQHQLCTGQWEGRRNE